MWRKNITRDNSCEGRPMDDGYTEISLQLTFEGMIDVCARSKDMTHDIMPRNLWD